MTYGTKILKNGKTRGYLIFDSGKRVNLTHEERADLENKIRYWEQCTTDKAASVLFEKIEKLARTRSDGERYILIDIPEYKQLK